MGYVRNQFSHHPDLQLDTRLGSPAEPIARPCAGAGPAGVVTAQGKAGGRLGSAARTRTTARLCVRLFGAIAEEGQKGRLELSGDATGPRRAASSPLSQYGRTARAG
jgi:hypothetical protein